MLRTDFALADLVVKDAEADSGLGVFHGVASTPDLDLGGDRVEAGAFGKIDPGTIPLLWAHDMKSPIGGWRDIDTSGRSMKVEGELNLDVPLGAQTHALLKRKHVTGLSIGFFIEPGGAEYDDKKGIRRITKGRLVEISVVPVPANDRARVKRVKSADGNFAQIEEFKTLLRDDYGFSDDEAEIVVTKGYHALLERRQDIPPAGLPAPVISQLRGFLAAL